MKKIFTLLLLIVIGIYVSASPVSFLKKKIKQPDGTELNCFVSGDEFYHWLHDADGYTIVKGSDSFYYYAVSESGKIVASEYRADSSSPETLGIPKWLKISREEYLERRKRFDVPENEQFVPTKSAQVTNGETLHSGTFNNIVIYIRFSGEAEFTTTRAKFDEMMNTGDISLQSYYKEVSYNNLTIQSYHYPTYSGESNLSYEDSHERGYFQPYDANTNTIGYTTSAQMTAREHKLLFDAVTWVNANSPVPTDLNIDKNGDGKVDNVAFMINGDEDTWDDLLWAHRWTLFSNDVYINGKLVRDYTFQPGDMSTPATEGNQSPIIVMCHEMFHSLGAPDLYHYDDGELSLHPIGRWGLMEGGSGHMGAYMKWKYGQQQWIASIPEITASGTYTLNSLDFATNNVYKIKSPYSTSEYFIVEYRKTGGYFESTLPGSGLIVYRINENFVGNAEFDGTNVFDEVYIYRPGGTTTEDGMINWAYYDADYGATEINDNTSPSSFLHDGSEGGLDISNITTAGTTISFDVTITAPANLTATASSSSQIDLAWDLNRNSDPVIIAVNTSNTFGTPVDASTYSVGNSITGGGEVIYKGTGTSYNHALLSPNTTYYYKAWSVLPGDTYSGGIEANAATECGTYSLPFTETFDAEMIPSCWSQVDYEGNGQIWQFGTTSSFGNGAPSLPNGNYAYLNSDAYGKANTQNVDLVTPTLDLTGFANVTIEFNHFHQFWSNTNASATLSYSIDDGSNWTQIQQWISSTINNPEAFSQVIPEIADKSQVKLKWNYTATWGGGWAIDDISITGTEIETLVWTGALSTAWDEPGNWSGNSVPTSANDVVIPAGLTNYPTLTEQSSGVCNNILIESSATSTGSLVGQENLNVQGNITVEQYLTGNAWHLVSSPAPGQTLSSFLSANTNIPMQNISGTDRRGMMDYNETINNWNSFFLESGQTGTFESGKGFSLRTTTDGTVGYTGVLATGAVSASATNSGTYGWNCVGNPYPSAICVNKAADGTNNFITANTGNFASSYAVVYVWERESDSYAIIGQGDDAYYAQSGQAFMVKVNTGASGVNFTTAMQTHKPGELIKSGTIDWGEIDLSVSKEGKRREARIKFNDAMTTGLDVSYDAGVFKTGFDIYTKLVEDNGVDFGLQCLPETGMEQYEIPVGIDVATGGELTFSLKSENLPSGIVPVLNDKLTGASIEFSGEEDVYTATITDAAKGYGRFTLTFSSTTGINESASSNFKAWYSEGYIYISGQMRGVGEATVYDINGRKVAIHQLLYSTQNKIEAPAGSSSIYLVKIKDSRRSEVLKVPVVGR